MTLPVVQSVRVFPFRDGKIWSTPVRVADFAGDGGYPASVQRADGQVVTAFYASKTPEHSRYHMGVAIWDPQRAASD